MINDLNYIYDIDNEQWLKRTIEILKEKRLEELDLEHLIEELEILSRRDRLAVESILEQIIRHLLLLEYWREEYDYNANHWKAEIMSFRSQLNDYLTTNLQKHLQENQSKVYQKALKYVKQKTGYTVDFPEESLYQFEQLIDPNWLP